MKNGPCGFVVLAPAGSPGVCAIAASVTNRLNTMQPVNIRQIEVMRSDRSLGAIICLQLLNLCHRQRGGF